MPRVSIGMPVHEAGSLLRPALDSLLSQTFGDFELVISDNASSDETPAICREYAGRDSRIRYIRQPTNIGPMPNFNYVFNASTAEYFKWVAHDDLHAPEFLAECVAALDGNHDAALCSPKTALIDRYGQPLGPVAENLFLDSDGEIWSIPTYRDRNLSATAAAARFQAVIGQFSMCFEMFGLMRRTALERTSLMGSYWGADKVLLAELALLGRFVLLDSPLFIRRCHRAQSSALGQKEREEWIGGSRWSLRLQQIRMVGEYLKLLRKYRRSINMLDGLNSLCARAASPAKVRQVAHSLVGTNVRR